MPYTKTSWVDGSAPAISASNLNKIETGIYDALRQDGTTAMSGQLVVTSGSATTPSIAASGDANTGVFFPTADTLAIGTGGTERLRVNSSGQVGIGTSSPSNNLEISGSASTVGATITNTNSGSYSFLSLRNTGASGIDYQIVNGGSASANPNLFYIYDATVHATRLAINSSGNVGIGTSSPSDLLHIVKNGEVNIKVESTLANSESKITALNSSGKGLILLMYGSGKSTYGSINANEGSLYSDQPISIVSDNSLAGVIKFSTNGAVERMRITTEGYLLIGYTSSNGAYPLQVNGQIFATSATIATSDKNYKENIKPLTDALTIVNALNPVSFDWKEHPVHNFDRTQPTIGFIAQEVAEVLKDKPYLDSLVKKSVCEWETETGETVEREVTREVTREITEEVDGEEVKRTITEEITEVVTEAVKEKHTEEFYGIAESNLIAILTKAVQELSAEVKALKAQIK